MVLRGQGDSPVRICDPCKKLEEAARYELRHGSGSKPTTKGNLKAGPSEEDELLAQILGAHKKSSEVPARLQGTSSSSSSSKDPSLNEENEIIRSFSAITPQKESRKFPDKHLTAIQSDFDGETGTNTKMSETTNKQDLEVSAFPNTMGLNANEGAGGEPYNLMPERKVRKKSEGEIKRELLVLKMKAIQLRMQGRKEEAESELGKAKELEEQLAELDSHSVPISEQLLIPQPAVETVSSALRITEKPVQVTQAEAPLLDILPAGKTIHVDPINKDPLLSDHDSLKNEIISHKRKALALKREGKISEAKEELRQAKLLEKNLEESNQTTNLTVTTKSEESDREPERGKLLENELEEADSRSKLPVNTNPRTDNTYPLDMGDEIGDSGVTESEMQDPNVLSVLHNLRWDEKEDSGTAASNIPVKHPPRKNKLVILRELLAVKRRALALRREGKIEESQRVLEGAQLLERELDDLNTAASEMKDRRTSQPNTAVNLNPSGGRSSSRNKLAIQRELLAVKKHALALRREGKIEESDRELERGELLGMN